MNYDAILVTSFGGPEERADVMPFLENVLRGKNVPVVFMTGYDERAIERGYTDVPCMQKPVTVERLMQALFG